MTRKTSPSVLITGASTGIGLACAQRLCADGWRVYAGVRKEADAERLRRELPGDLRPVQLDVCKADEIAGVAARLADELGEAGLDGLVNNAGIALAAPLEFVRLEDLRRQLEINVVGLAAVTAAMLPLLRRSPRPRIVHMGSSSGRVAVPFLGPYAASKFAVEALGDSLRRELRPWGMAVSIVEPGAIATPIWEKSSNEADAVLEAMPPEALALYGGAVDTLRAAVEETTRRAIPPERVAAAVAHALTARRPRTRYPVGLDARVQSWLARWLPDRWLDALLARFMAL